MRLSLAGLLVATTVASSALHGQTVGFESLFKDITDINFFYSCWNTKGPIKGASCPSVKSGYGVEVSYDLGKIRLPGSKTEKKPPTWADTTRTLPCPGAGECTTGCLTCGGSVTSYRRGGTSDPYWYLRTEFALSYSQFSGFESTDPSFDLRGSVRELPGLAFYTTLEVSDSVPAHTFLDVLAPYVGIKSGLIQLNSVQALDRGTDGNFTAYNGASTAFQVGAALGAVLSFERLHFFVEQSWSIRRFANVQWSTTGTNKVPMKFPTSLDFSGSTITVGVQLSIKGK